MQILFVIWAALLIRCTTLALVASRPEGIAAAGDVATKRAIQAALSGFKLLSTDASRVSRTA